MANVKPLKGILYNTDKIDLAKVVTPPYDVISQDQQESYYNIHENNIIRLILGKNEPGDNESNNRYIRASQLFNLWMNEKVLIQDEDSSFYFTAMDYSINGKSMTRYGIIARVGLEKFESGVVKPHEKTFSKTISDRLKLMQQCHTNFSPIFSLFSDTNNEILNIFLNASKGIKPDMEIVDERDHGHRVWRIKDSQVKQKIINEFDKKNLFIADGHHRYSTALEYLEWLEDKNGKLPDDHPAKYIMMYLTGMEDPGLIILPAHRKVTNVNESITSSFLNKAEEFFNIKKFPFNEDNKNEILHNVVHMLSKQNESQTIFTFIKGTGEFVLLTLKPDSNDKLSYIEEPLRNLDVTLITRVIFEKIIGFSQEDLDNEEQITYTSNINQAISEVDNGNCTMAFLLNPTKIEQVREVANAGLIMPRKSTYFYPKVITGLVINSLK